MRIFDGNCSWGLSYYHFQGDDFRPFFGHFEMNCFFFLRGNMGMGYNLTMFMDLC